MNEARLFWVVESPEDSPEIFETRQQADNYAKVYGKESPYRIYIAEVMNYYKDDEVWTYEDLADTFAGFTFTVTVQSDTRSNN